MSTRSKIANAEEIAAIEDLLSDLEKRLKRLSQATHREVSGASGEVRDFVSEALAGIMDRVRESAAEVGENIGSQASRAGNQAMHKISEQLEERPFAMLAIAAGIGFLFGLANRR